MVADIQHRSCYAEYDQLCPYRLPAIAHRGQYGRSDTQVIERDLVPVFAAIPPQQPSGQLGIKGSFCEIKLPAAVKINRSLAEGIAEHRTTPQPVIMLPSFNTDEVLSIVVFRVGREVSGPDTGLHRPEDGGGPCIREF